MHRLTKQAWFAPKRHLGWGLTISTWQGLVLTVVAVALVIAAVLLIAPVPAGLLAAGCIVIAYVAIAVLTSDGPGGPKPSDGDAGGLTGSA